MYNDVIDMKAELRFLIHHSNTDSPITYHVSSYIINKPIILM